MQIKSFVSKGGRSRTGSDRKGAVIHIVAENEQNGFWCTPALCGEKPRKGYGWLNIDPDWIAEDCICSNCKKYH